MKSLPNDMQYQCMYASFIIRQLLENQTSDFAALTSQTISKDTVAAPVSPDRVDKGQMSLRRARGAMDSGNSESVSPSSANWLGDEGSCREKVQADGF